MRFLLFFVAVFLLTGVLAQVPGVGVLFRIPFLGFWFTAILLSALLARAGTVAVDAGRRRALERTLGAVETAHHKGKLAALHLAQGHRRRALPLFAEAMAMAPESLEWRYGFARAAEGGGAEERARGLEVLEAVLAEDEEHAFGDAMLLAARMHRAAGDGEQALDRVHRFERNHGPSPESALLRGRLLKGLGDGDAAGRAFDEALALARSHRGARAPWLGLRARWARWFG